MKATKKEVWAPNTSLIYTITIGLRIKSIHSQDFMNEKKEMYCIQSKYTPTLLLNNESYIHYQQLWMLMHTCLIRQPFTMITFFCEYL